MKRTLPVMEVSPSKNGTSYDFPPLLHLHITRSHISTLQGPLPLMRWTSQLFRPITLLISNTAVLVRQFFIRNSTIVGHYFHSYSPIY